MVEVLGTPVVRLGHVPGMVLGGLRQFFGDAVTGELPGDTEPVAGGEEVHQGGVVTEPRRHRLGYNRDMEG